MQNNKYRRSRKSSNPTNQAVKGALPDSNALNDKGQRLETLGQSKRQQLETAEEEAHEKPGAVKDNQDTNGALPDSNALGEERQRHKNLGQSKRQQIETVEEVDHVKPRAVKDNEDANGALPDSNALSEMGQRLKTLRQQKRHQIETVEEEAHEKPRAVLDFEAQMLDKRVDPPEIQLSEDRPGETNNLFEFNANENHYKKKRIYYFLATAAGYWDIIMCVNTFLHIHDHGAIHEILVRGEAYNCNDNTEGITSRFQLIYVGHMLATMLLLYSLMKRRTKLLSVWIVSKLVTIVFFTCKVAPELRIRPEDELFRPELFFFFPLMLILYCLQLLLVLIVIMDIEKPYYRRQQLLQVKKSLNREIYYKSLPPILQRKYSLRWAEYKQFMQAINTITKLRSNYEGKKQSKPTDEELEQYFADGLKSFNKAYGLETDDFFP